MWEIWLFLELDYIWVRNWWLFFVPWESHEAELHHTCEEEESPSCQTLLSYCSAAKDFSLLHSSGSSLFHQRWIQSRNFQSSIVWFSFPLIMALLLSSIRLHFCNLRFAIFIFATAIWSLYLHVRMIKHCLIQLSLITSVKPKMNCPWQEWIPWDMPRKDFPFLLWQCWFNTCYL